MKPNDDHHLTTSQAARVLGVGVDTIRRHADAGHLACTRTPGGHRRFRLGDLTKQRPPAETRVALYVPYTFRPASGQQEGLKALAAQSNLTPTYLVQEYEVDQARDLPDRPGFQKIVEMAGRGQIQGFVIPNSHLVGGWPVAKWLRICHTLGLTCYTITEDSDDLEQFPGDLLPTSGRW